MSDVSKPTDNDPTPPKNSAALLLLRDIGDTTWRMFVPTIGGTLFGLWIDLRYNTLPWSMVAGVVIGAIITVLLLRQQLMRLSD